VDTPVVSDEDLADAAQKVNKWTPLYVPDLMGCGLAGGDWSVYSSILEAFVPHATVVIKT
jgi:hypothetical protein